MFEEIFYAFRYHTLSIKLQKIFTPLSFPAFFKYKIHLSIHLHHVYVVETIGIAVILKTDQQNIMMFVAQLEIEFFIHRFVNSDR